jgi:putative PEP-CTERM system histidine kinase
VSNLDAESAFLAALTWLPVVSAVSCALLAVGAVLRDRRSAAHWAYFAGMLVLGAEAFSSWRSGLAASPAELLRWQQWRFTALSPLIAIWLAFSLVYARGNAREFVTRWRLVLVTVLAVPVALAVFFPGDLLRYEQDAATHTWTIGLGLAGKFFCTLLLVGSIAVLMNLERTYRASIGTMRWRIKFMLLGIGVIFVARLYTTSEMMLFRGIDRSLEQFTAGTTLVAVLLMIRSFLRTGSAEVDVYPSPTFLQGSLTALLAGIYLVIVGVLAQLVTYFGGDAVFNLKALIVLIAIVLLAILLQSDRLRLQLRRFVSRHLQRPLYDYRTAWKKLLEATASCVEQKDIARALVRLTADMFQVLSVTIWLVNDHKDALRLAASTSLAESSLPHSLLEADTAAVIEHFRQRPEPAALEPATEGWALALKNWHPMQFPEKGGNRVCLPMIGRGEFLGLIVLGDRVGGVPFSLQDFDLLQSVGEHAAASLLNVQLSQKLVQARELEAFQAMAAFFVHDMKNAGSTLNLMLQNLPVHFDDPVFRQDALRGIGKTVGHLNRLIARLTQLRGEMTIQAQPADLNEVVQASLAGIEAAAGSNIAKVLKPLGRVRLDPEQMHKVITNLLLNAIEASPANAGIRVATDEDATWAVLSVADQGCGMSPEFMRNSLFRPFQTSKAGGLGIGMFQSRMIVEAHGGKIAVASEPGRGTTFQVFLPKFKEVR